MGATDDGGNIRQDASRDAPETRARQVAAVLRRRILLGALPPGAAIHERDTARALGVSRTPLREAVRLLVNEGLLNIAPARSPQVTNPSLDDLTQLLVVQEALEGRAGEIACTTATDADLARVAELNDAMLALSWEGDPLERFEIDMAFHAAIVEAARNRPLIETHRQYNARLWRARYLSAGLPRNRERTLAEHRSIVEAFCARDPQRTAQALRTHLRSALENLSAVLARAKADGDHSPSTITRSRTAAPRANDIAS